jgi:uncharacterized membrane protein
MSYPIKLSFKSEIAPIIFVVASWILAFYFYAHFPAQVITHWNFVGKPDHYGTRASAAFILPAVITILYLVFLSLPWIDPKSERFAEFSDVYNFFKAAIVFVLLAIFIATGLADLGYPVEIRIVTPVLVGLLFIAIGNFMGKIKRNWFFGVRTPWTLSSENVWTKTNRFGGFTMVIFGILLVVSPLLPEVFFIPLFILSLATLIVGTFVYSFVIFKREKVENKINQF